MSEILLKDEGRLEEAVALNRERMAIVRKEDGEMHPESLRTRGQLGELLAGLDRLDEAHDLLSKTLADARIKLGDAYPVTVEIMIALARCQAKRGEIDEAAKLLDEAVSLSSPPERAGRIRLAIDFNERHGRELRADELRAKLVGEVVLE
jgi:tetratricopeptide (TPR) repeat protein